MEQLHRDVLREMRVYLLTELDLETVHVLDHLQQESILNETHCDKIKSQGTHRAQTQAFLDTLDKCGPRAYGGLLRALKETNAQWIAEAIEEKEQYPFQYILPVSFFSVNQSVVTFARMSF